jgi:Fe-S cluster assembly protein SufD
MTVSAKDQASWLTLGSDQTLVGHGLKWLQLKRDAALTHFNDVGLPGVRDEDWRYTNLRALKDNVYSLSGPNSDFTPALEPSDNSRMVFVDGHFRDDLSDRSKLNDGVIFSSLADVLDTQPELIEKTFGKCLPEQQHGFTALNTAYSQDGFVLILAANTVVPNMLEICFYNTGKKQGADHCNSHCRNLIIANANSQCTVVERHFGSDDAVYLNNTVTEINAGDNAQVDHYKLQQESDEAFHVGGIFIKQSSNSTVRNHNIALSGLLTRNDITCDLLGQGAHIEMNGLVIGSARQHIDNHTAVTHAAANCSSDEFYKTILDDRSRSVFRGRIVVAQDAQLTVADQTNNNLLLSENAEADSKPQLEIYADDVKCSHGATVGQLDQVSLFYLRSRGIGRQSAIALLTFAFANEVLERMQIKSIRKQLGQQIAGQLLDETDPQELS